jgi:hypothetical protein
LMIQTASAFASFKDSKGDFGGVNSTPLDFSAPFGPTLTEMHPVRNAKVVIKMAQTKRCIFML